MCIYRMQDGICKKHSTNGVLSYCVDGPCPDKTVPVVSGKWIPYDASYYRHYNYGAYPVNLIRFKCSVCGRTTAAKKSYCRCGAKMNKEDNNA